MNLRGDRSDDKSALLGDCLDFILLRGLLYFNSLVFVLNSETPHLFKAPFSSFYLIESLIFSSFIHTPRDTSDTYSTSDLSNPSHRCPFISPPAEFIILDLIEPPSPHGLFVLCSLSNTGSHLLFHSTPGFVPSPRSVSFRRSLSFAFPSTFTQCALALGAAFSCDLYLSTAVCLINTASCPGRSPNPASLQGGRDTRWHTPARRENGR